MPGTGQCAFPTRPPSRSYFYLRPIPKSLRNSLFPQDKNASKSDLSPEANLATLKVWSSGDLMDPARLEILQDTFDQVIGRFASFSGLLTEIKNEYGLVLAALQNMTDEKRYLRAKLSKLVCENGSQQSLDSFRSLLIQLSFRKEMIERENAVLIQTDLDESKQFVALLGRHFPTTLPGDIAWDKQRHLRLKDRWEWIVKFAETKQSEPVMKDLYQRLIAQEDMYQAVLDQDDLSDLISATASTTSPQLKRIQAEIEEQYRQIQESQMSLAEVKRSQGKVEEELMRVYGEVECVEVLLESLRKKAGVTQGAAETAVPEMTDATTTSDPEPMESPVPEPSQTPQAIENEDSPDADGDGDVA
ncbi:hypothetical protein DFS34DRAFT_214836 [Phlyctochytrium arcticum]|nr:hypothetical protein DFS34DRAFT_214836 [Phlyctochytrium arcticum]